MTPKDLERFFEDLASRWPHPTTILLTGGAGAFVLGGSRPTDDVDFEVRFHKPETSWEAFAAEVKNTSEQTGIGAQYAESIDRWSQITLLDYRDHTTLVKRYGAIEVRVLNPLYWSIGKISRFYDQDAQDLIAVFRQHQPDPIAVARLWARTLRESPRSTQLKLTLDHALYFFKMHGKAIWGEAFSMASIQEVFSPKPSH